MESLLELSQHLPLLYNGPGIYARTKRLYIYLYNSIDIHIQNICLRKNVNEKGKGRFCTFLILEEVVNLNENLIESRLKKLL